MGAPRTAQQDRPRYLHARRLRPLATVADQQTSRLWGKHHRHGLHFLALTDEKGRLIWISAARPGRTHDATATRHDKIIEHLKAVGLGALADLGFIGVDKPKNPDDLVIVTGFKATRARKLTPGQKQANQILAAARAPVEHGFAHLKTGESSPSSAPTRPAPLNSCALYSS